MQFKQWLLTINSLLIMIKFLFIGIQHIVDKAELMKSVIFSIHRTREEVPNSQRHPPQWHIFSWLLKKNTAQEVRASATFPQG